MPERLPAAGLRLCAAADIAEGTARGFDPGNTGTDTLFLVRVGGVLKGWRNACPHIDGAPMAWRKDAYLDAEGRMIMCHAHGAEFSPESGECLRGPCRGRHLDAVPITTTGDGGVFISPAWAE